MTGMLCTKGGENDVMEITFQDSLLRKQSSSSSSSSSAAASAAAAAAIVKNHEYE